MWAPCHEVYGTNFTNRLQFLVQITEQALDSTSSQQGTITIGLPGLPDGVNVTKSVEHFFVDDGRILLERNEVRVRSSPPFCLQILRSSSRPFSTRAVSYMHCLYTALHLSSSLCSSPHCELGQALDGTSIRCL